MMESPERMDLFQKSLAGEIELPYTQIGIVIEPTGTVAVFNYLKHRSKEVARNVSREPRGCVSCDKRQ
jgi:hypothetical protein